MSPEINNLKLGAKNEVSIHAEPVLVDEEAMECMDSLADEPDRLKTSSPSGGASNKSFLELFTTSKGPPQIMIMLVLMTFGFGSTAGVMPGIFTDRYARLNGYTGDKDCSEFENPDLKPELCQLASDDAQNAVSVSNFVSCMLSFLSSTMIGSLSDEYGRRCFMLIGLFLIVLSGVAFVLVQFIPSVSPNLFYIADAATGIVDFSTVAISSLADVIPNEWRAPSFGMLLAGESLGFAIAPMLGLLFRSHDHLVIFAVSMVTSSFLFTYFCFPETLPPERAQATRESRRAETAHMTTSEYFLNTITRPFWELLILNRSKILRILSFLAFFSGMVDAGDGILLFYYVVDQLSFSDKDMAIIIILFGVLGVLIQGILLKPLNDFFGEKLLLTISFLLGAVTNVFYGIAKNKATIFVAVVFASFNSMTFPTISAIKSNNAEENEQGRIQGALCSIQSLASATGPVFLRLAYLSMNNQIGVGPGSMFLFAAGLYAVVSVVACALPSDQANSRTRNNYGKVPLDDGLATDYHATAQEVNSETAMAPVETSTTQLRTLELTSKSLVVTGA